MSIAEQAEHDGFAIRELCIDDAEMLLEFYSSLPESVTDLFQPFGVVSLDVLRDHLEQTASGEHISIGIVDVDGRIQGHAFVLFCDAEKPIFGIGLAESQHGHGRGRMLAEAVLSVADARGLPLVTLTVLKINHRAMKLYESLGFDMTGESTFKVENDSFYMERRDLFGKATSGSIGDGGE